MSGPDGDGSVLTSVKVAGASGYLPSCSIGLTLRLVSTFSWQRSFDAERQRRTTDTRPGRGVSSQITLAASPLALRAGALLPVPARRRAIARRLPRRLR